MKTVVTPALIVMLCSSLEGKCMTFSLHRISQVALLDLWTRREKIYLFLVKQGKKMSTEMHTLISF